MTSWLSPSVLARSAAEVVLSGLFANFADKRESEGGLSAETFPCDPQEPGEYWLDYVADVGDGFASTYTIARLLAREELTVEGLATKRGRTLVFGGDEVYPSASWQRYSERFKQPYAAALPSADEPPPGMFAVPGNHDWYDGLTNFMRVFCQGSTIGGWQTRQRRSYFALQLPHKWWLWGIDIQFDAYIDGPQIAYFTEVAKQATKDHRIILATAKPSWIHVEDPDDPPQSWMSLAYFKQRVMCVNGAELALTITGDAHHYSRYEGDGDPKITAGGGGAYLSATHWLPQQLVLPALDGPERSEYELVKRWPTLEESRALRSGILGHLLPWRTFSLNELIACIYAAVLLVLAVGLKDQATSLAGGGSLWDALSLWAVLLAGVLLAGLAAWARSGHVPWPIGALHGLVQLGSATAIALVALNWDPFGLADDGFWLAYALVIPVGVVGALVGRTILVLYLYVVQQIRDRWHVDEVFAAQAREAGSGWKHFVRFRIHPGGLDMYVIGMRDVPRRFSDYPLPEPDGGFPEPVLVDSLNLTTSVTSAS